MSHFPFHLFYYDNGLRWNCCPPYRPEISKGDLVGYRHSGTGYWRLKWKGKQTQLHILVWCFHNGNIPTGYLVDHIDRNKDNNLIENLRLVTLNESNQNRGKQQTKQSCRFKGVYPSRNKWMARIHLQGKNQYLGTFDSPEEASKAYQDAAKKHYIAGAEYD